MAALKFSALGPRSLLQCCQASLAQVFAMVASGRQGRGQKGKKQLGKNVPIQFVGQKKEGSQSAARFAKYKAAGTIAEARALGALAKDIAFDLKGGQLQPIRRRPASASTYCSQLARVPLHKTAGADPAQAQKTQAELTLGSIAVASPSVGAELVSKRPSALHETAGADLAQAQKTQAELTLGSIAVASPSVGAELVSKRPSAEPAACVRAASFVRAYTSPKRVLSARKIQVELQFVALTRADAQSEAILKQLWGFLPELCSSLGPGSGLAVLGRALAAIGLTPQLPSRSGMTPRVWALAALREASGYTGAGSDKESWRHEMDGLAGSSSAAVRKAEAWLVQEYVSVRALYPPQEEQDS